MSIRVLVVDDSAFMRKMISEMISSESGLEVVGTARNGADAIVKAVKYEPDLITLDIEMPEMSGLEALRRILHTDEIDPKPRVLMCSSLTVDGSTDALHALKLGASDFIAKDPEVVGKGDKSFHLELVTKIKAIAKPAGPRRHRRASGVVRPPVQEPNPSKTGGKHVRVHEISQLLPTCIAIGSSTGGPPVVETLICSLCSGFPIPVFIAQHMPSLFTKSLAKRLDAMANLEVKVGVHGEEVRPGVVYIGEGGSHLRVRRSGSGCRLEVSPKPEEALYKPSVNELYASVAREYGDGVLAFMLTGMGDDGVVGSRDVVDSGGQIVTQDADSCVVYGMPRAVVDGGMSSGSATPKEMASILRSIGEGLIKTGLQSA